MTKEELKNQIASKINPIIEDLKVVLSGPIGQEEYGKTILYKSDVRIICDALFNEMLDRAEKLLHEDGTLTLTYRLQIK
jgi:hypothetical protein